MHAGAPREPWSASRETFRTRSRRGRCGGGPPPPGAGTPEPGAWSSTSPTTTTPPRAGRVRWYRASGPRLGAGLRHRAQSLASRLRELVLDRLIETLLSIAVEHAGAQRGLLICPRGAEYDIEAEVVTARGRVEVTHQKAPVTPSDLPLAILHYVVRTQESVILDDAAAPNLFSDDAYVRARRPRSVLCLALVKQRTLVGVLYLENNLTPRAFTEGRIAMLELLASQSAISLENARLYTQLQRENSERKRAEIALLERESRIRRLVDSNIIGISFWDFNGEITDANDAFLDLVGYTRQDLVSGTSTGKR